MIKLDSLEYYVPFIEKRNRAEFVLENRSFNVYRAAHSLNAGTPLSFLRAILLTLAKLLTT